MPNRMLQQKPITFMLEAATICNRNCEFCGLATTPTEKIDDPFMDVDLAKAIAEDMDWAAPLRIRAQGYGEPLLHPNYLEFVRVIRKQRPESQITIFTNGDMLRAGKYTIDELFKAGLNQILLDSYDEKSKKWVNSLDREVKDYEEVKVHKRHSPEMKRIIHIDNSRRFSDAKSNRYLYNVAGNVDKEVYRKYGKKYPNHPLRKMCVRPFRQMHFRWDGCVEMCCADVKSEFIFGKFPEQSTEEIWKSEIYNIVRKLLLQKKRYVIPCYKCDHHGGFRKGLVYKPDVTLENWEEKIKKHLQKWEDKTLASHDIDDYIKKRGKNLKNLIKHKN